MHKTPNAACRQREAVYNARVEKLRRDATEQLKIGVKKEDVVRVFEQNGLPVEFHAGVAEGTIQTQGCSPSGCGNDDAILGLRVRVDRQGTVIGEPAIGAIYTDCL
jgi:hypothetical protein